MPAFSQSSVRLYEEDAFDRVILTDEFNNESVDVFPLSPRQRQSAEARASGEYLTVRLLEYPEKEYEIDWEDIDQITYFEQLVLAEANTHIDAGRYDEAFRYLSFLRRQYPGTPELDETIEEFLVQDAFDQFKLKRLDAAYAILSEVNRLNPERRGLKRAFSRIAGEIFDRYLANGDYDAARQFLQNSASQFGAVDIEQTLEQREQELIEKAEQLMESAQQSLDSGDVREAYRISRRVLSVWPSLKRAQSFAEAVSQRYPLVTVAVSRSATDLDPRRMGDWAARRAGRLVHRQLTEFVEYGPDGGTYESPWTKITTSSDRREVTLSLNSDQGSSTPRITGHDIANFMLRMSVPDDPSFSALWSQSASGVELDDVYQLRFQFKHPVLRPENLFQVPFMEGSGAASRFPTHPYRRETDTGGETRFLKQSDYYLARPTQPFEILEVPYSDGAAAREAFRSGEADIIDRVFPADIAALSSLSGVRVGEYTSPSIHMLIPNLKRPFPASRTFRRAVTYGINRSLILRRDILGDRSIDGCRLISGPIPVGRDNEDPLGFGYDEEIALRPYEPSLALALFEVAKRELITRAGRMGEPVPEVTALRILHPPADIPRAACAAVAQQLATIGIAAEAIEMRAGQVRPDVDDWDLYYADVVMDEPLFDVRRLLGSAGLVRGGSAYLELALRQLSQVTNWARARERMYEIHRLAHQELVVIPLWQIVDHFAYHEHVEGITDKRVSLYEGVEQWAIGVQRIGQNP